MCDDVWDDLDAKVVCRMIGFKNGIGVNPTKYAGHPKNNNPFGLVPSADFSMDQVQCTGEETNILDCPHDQTHNCGVNEGAGVRCSM